MNRELDAPKVCPTCKKPFGAVNKWRNMYYCFCRHCMLRVEVSIWIDEDYYVEPQ